MNNVSQVISSCATWEELARACFINMFVSGHGFIRAARDQ